MAAFCQRSSSSTGECYHCRGLVKVGGVVHAAIRTPERLGFPDVQLGVLLLAMPLLMRNKLQYTTPHLFACCWNVVHRIEHAFSPICVSGQGQVLPYPRQHSVVLDLGLLDLTNEVGKDEQPVLLEVGTCTACITFTSY